MNNRHGIVGQGRGIARFIAFTYPQARRKIWTALTLLILSGLTEGLSLVLLLPVLTHLSPGAEDLRIAVPSVLAGLVGAPELTVGLAPVLAGLVLLVISQAILARISSLVTFDAVLTVADRLRLTLFGSIALARWGYLAGARHSDLTQAVTSDVERVHEVMQSLLLVVQASIMLAIYVAVSLFISPVMTAVTCAMGLTFILLLHPIRRQASLYGQRVTAQRQAQYRNVAEFLGGLKLVKSLNMEPRYLRAFSATAEDTSAGVRRYGRIAAAPGLLFQALSAVAGAFIIYVAVRLLALPLEHVAVLLFVFLRISPRFTAIQTNLQHALLNLAGFDSVMALIGQARGAQEPRGRARRGPRLTSCLKFEAVAFTFEGATAPTLKDIDLEIAARRVTAIIGPSGGGKSTIADLMMGLIEPTAGSLIIDDVPLSDENRRAWREHVAYVPQEVFLSHDTLAVNLRMADPKADEASLWRALGDAGASGFVEALPQGLHTVVGERGVRLSGGERQRIALARALLRRPDLLILDEATSALDWENQRLIAEAIARLRGDVTVVTIAHRPSMIAFADEVIAVEDGRIVERGSFAEVSARLDSRLSRMLVGESVAERPSPSV